MSIEWMTQVMRNTQMTAPIEGRRITKLQYCSPYLFMNNSIKRSQRFVVKCCCKSGEKIKNKKQIMVTEKHLVKLRTWNVLQNVWRVKLTPATCTCGSTIFGRDVVGVHAAAAGILSQLWNNWDKCSGMLSSSENSQMIYHQFFYLSRVVCIGKLFFRRLDDIVRWMNEKSLQTNNLSGDHWAIKITLIHRRHANAILQCLQTGTKERRNV